MKPTLNQINKRKLQCGKEISYLSYNNSKNETPRKCGSSHPEVFCKKGVLRNFAQENTGARVSFLIKLQV